MLVTRLRKDWRARASIAPLDTAPRFEPDGLVLGAGTVLVKTGGDGEADAARLRALLAVAYGRPAAEAGLGHVKAAAARWRQGDLGQAGVHLALSRLGRLPHGCSWPTG